jgi:hypothetical protein
MLALYRRRPGKSVQGLRPPAGPVFSSKPAKPRLRAWCAIRRKGADGTGTLPQSLGGYESGTREGGAMGGWHEQVLTAQALRTNKVSRPP